MRNRCAVAGVRTNVKSMKLIRSKEAVSESIAGRCGARAAHWSLKASCFGLLPSDAALVDRGVLRSVC